MYKMFALILEAQRHKKTKFEDCTECGNYLLHYYDNFGMNANWYERTMIHNRIVSVIKYRGPTQRYMSSL